MKIYRQLLLIILICQVYSPYSICFADQTKMSQEIVLGQSCDLEGPYKDFGTNFKDGALAYFSKVNEAGGIKGKKIKLISYNDSSDSGLVLKNTEKLIEVDKVFALFGYADVTSTYSNIIPFIQKANIPFFAPVSGSESLRVPLIKQVFCLRAGFNEESKAMVDRLTDNGLKRIGIVYEENETGSSASDSARKIMEKKNLPVAFSANIDSSLKNIDEAIKTTVTNNPDAVIIAASSRTASEFIARIKAQKTESLFIAFSFADGDSMGKSLLNKGLGVIINQVVPFPNYLKIPVIAEYTKLTEKYMPKTEPTFAGVEGFIAAKAFCRILEETEGSTITREAFYKAADSQDDTDIGGFTFTFSPKERAGSKFVYMTQIGPGGFVTPIKNLSDIYK